jgi:hypothetical protein
VASRRKKSEFGTELTFLDLGKVSSEPNSLFRFEDHSPAQSDAVLRAEWRGEQFKPSDLLTFL